MVTPRWVARLVWMVRGRRLVLLHLIDQPSGPLPSIEGILVGRWSGFYVLVGSRLVESEDGPTTPMGDVEVPEERVAFVQVLGKGVR